MYCTNTFHYLTFSKLNAKILSTYRCQYVEKFHKFADNKTKVLYAFKKQHFPTKQLIQNKKNVLQTQSIIKSHLHKAYNLKLVPYAPAIYKLYAETLKTDLIGLFWILADKFQEQMKKNLVYPTYKQLMLYNSDLDFKVNNMQYYKLINKLKISLNSLAKALRYQISTRTRSKLLNMLYQVQTKPIQAEFLDPKTGNQIYKSEILLLSISVFTDENREKSVELEFNSALFAKVFFNLILYRPGLVEDFFRYLEKNNPTKKIPKVAVPCLLVVLQKIKKQETELNLFLSCCTATNKKDKIIYTQILFFAVNFLITKKIINKWFLISNTVVQPIYEFKDFKNKINYRRKDQLIMLEL